jgi:hypothetical protein
MQNISTVEPDDDVLNGLGEIATFIRRNKRRTHYLYKTGRLGDGVRKVGPRTIIGSKRKLRAVLKGDLE